MINPKPRVIFLLCLTIVFSSCTKVIDIETPDHDSKLVINSLFKGGERLSLNISESTSISGSIPPGVFDSYISIYRNDTLVQIANSTDSIFYSNIVPVQNNHYSIEISSPGFETVIATDSLPSRVRVSKIESTDIEWVDDIGMKYKLIRIEFTDTDTSDNYFELKLRVRFSYPDDSPYGFSHIIEIANIGGIHDPVLDDSWSLYGYSGGFLFTDKLFKNNKCNIEVFAGVLNNEAEEYQLLVDLNTVSEPYYNFKKKLGMYMKSADENILTSVSDPVELFTNIENGYGVFAGYMNDHHVLNITKQ